MISDSLEWLVSLRLYMHAQGTALLSLAEMAVFASTNVEKISRRTQEYF